MRKQHWLFAMMLAGTIAAWAQQSTEQRVMELANADRAQQGLPPLKWDSALAQAAAEHAQAMAEQPALSHQYPGEPDLVARAGAAGAHFRSIAENVGPGPKCGSPGKGVDALHSASCEHPDPRMNAIGVGMVKRGGNLYAVEDFADGVAALGPQQIELQIGQLLRQRGLQPAAFTQDARQSCEMEHGSAGGSSPRFIMRWEGSDLSRLPDVLEQKIATHQYTKAPLWAPAVPRILSKASPPTK